MLKFCLILFVVLICSGSTYAIHKFAELSAFLRNSRNVASNCNTHIRNKGRVVRRSKAQIDLRNKEQFEGLDVSRFNHFRRSVRNGLFLDNSEKSEYQPLQHSKKNIIQLMTRNPTEFLSLAAKLSSALGMYAISRPAQAIVSNSFLSMEIAVKSTENSDVMMIVQFILGSFLATLLVVIIQGGFAIYNYKTNFGDAPPPKVPAHGVVLATSRNQTSTSRNRSSEARYEESSAVTKSNFFANKKNFLRMLLIGDSLAVGIGQASSCTPVMPESIAKVISKGTGNAVYWTCVGESGASTSWIVQMLKNSTETIQDTNEFYKPPDFQNWTGKNRKFHGNYFTNGSDTYAAHGLWADSNHEHMVNGANDLTKEWKKRLSSYRDNFDPAAMGPYDIVILLTGSNDLKTLLFPFMLDEDDKSFQSKNGHTTGVTENLNLLMQTINDKVQFRLQKVLDMIRVTADEMVENIWDSTEFLYQSFNSQYLNQSSSEQKDQLLQTSMSNIRDRADDMYEDIAARIEKLSDTIRVLTSNNYTLTEKVNRSVQQPLDKFKKRTSAVRDEILDAASSTFHKLRMNYDELERLFSLTNSFSQIYLHEDFNNQEIVSKEIQQGETAVVVTSSNNYTSKNQSKAVTTAPHMKAIKTSQQTPLDDVIRPSRPIFVLPAMPARALPAFRRLPLKLIAVPVFDFMDNKKRHFAQNNPNILFVKDPSVKDIIDFENRHGSIWDESTHENVLLSIKDIRVEDCTSIEQSMRQYFQNKKGFHLKPLSNPLGIPGTKIFSPDQIHPNDYGYDFWGRHIGNAIVQHLNSYEIEQHK